MKNYKKYTVKISESEILNIIDLVESLQIVLGQDSVRKYRGFKAIQRIFKETIYSDMKERGEV